VSTGFGLYCRPGCPIFQAGFVVVRHYYLSFRHYCLVSRRVDRVHGKSPLACRFGVAAVFFSRHRRDAENVVGKPMLTGTAAAGS